MPVKPHHPKPEWNQAAFEQMKAGWSPERLAENEATLQEIFALAVDVPLLAEALAWAEDHDIRFFIDRSVTDCGGYYMWGTGVVALASKNIFFQVEPKKLNGMNAAEILVHELRHAWQDYHGLAVHDAGRKITRGFSEYFTKIALIEADAFAHGQRAVTQLIWASHQKHLEWEVPGYLRQAMDNEGESFGEDFINWFRRSWQRASLYGGDASSFYGYEWGVDGGDIYRSEKEHKPFPPHIRREGVDVHDIQDILRLGKCGFFGNKNYLAAMPREILLKEVLRPSLADTFWGAADDRQKKLTTDIRKAHLRKKLAHRPAVVRLSERSSLHARRPQGNRAPPAPR